MARESWSVAVTLDAAPWRWGLRRWRFAQSSVNWSATRIGPLTILVMPIRSAAYIRAQAEAYRATHWTIPEDP